LLLLANALPFTISPFWGMVADRMGRRRIFPFSLGVEATAMFFVAFSMN